TVRHTPSASSRPPPPPGTGAAAVDAAARCARPRPHPLFWVSRNTSRRAPPLDPVLQRLHELPPGGTPLRPALLQDGVDQRAQDPRSDRSPGQGDRVRVPVVGV